MQTEAKGFALASERATALVDRLENWRAAAAALLGALASGAMEVREMGGGADADAGALSLTGGAAGGGDAKEKSGSAGAFAAAAVESGKPPTSTPAAAVEAAGGAPLPAVMLLLRRC